MSAEQVEEDKSQWPNVFGISLGVIKHTYVANVEFSTESDMDHWRGCIFCVTDLEVICPLNSTENSLEC